MPSEQVFRQKRTLLLTFCLVSVALEKDCIKNDASVKIEDWYDINRVCCLFRFLGFSKELLYLPCGYVGQADNERLKNHEKEMKSN